MNAALRRNQAQSCDLPFPVLPHLQSLSRAPAGLSAPTRDSRPPWTLGLVLPGSHPALPLLGQAGPVGSQLPGGGRHQSSVSGWQEAPGDPGVRVRLPWGCPSPSCFHTEDHPPTSRASLCVQEVHRGICPFLPSFLFFLVLPSLCEPCTLPTL